jgi:hypothetical protein
MAKNKAFTPLLYFASIVFLPWWISLRKGRVNFVDKKGVVSRIRARQIFH